MNLGAAPFFLTGEELEQVEKTLAGMTDREKIGQLFCVMGGDYTPHQLKKMVAEGRVGGILFRPVKSGAEIREDFRQLDGLAKIPLLKAANLEEGGAGGAKDGTLFGWPMLTAATDDPAMAEKFGRVCGAQGSQVGINWTFSPVCDLDLNYQNPITNVRTYGSDTARVKAMTLAYMEGVTGEGVIPCAKHFPGDGVDYRDQHLHPTVNSLPARDWYDSYGAIYRNLIEKGLMSVMVGHIAQPAVARQADPALSEEQAYLPATLSPTLLQKVLRGKLGFNGLITTDATIMGGYTMAMERTKALPASIMAGCDMLVFNTDFEEDFRILEQALQRNTLTRERLDEAVRRILAFKLRACRTREPQPVPAHRWHKEAVDKAITLVKNTQKDALPVTPRKYPLIRLIVLGKEETPEGRIFDLARKYLGEKGFAVEGYDPWKDELHGTEELGSGRLTLYLANYEQASNQTVVRAAWCPKHALDIPRFLQEETCIFVSLANPYMLQDVPRVKTYINTYTATGTVIRSVIDKLMGESPFLGTNPVDPFCGLPDTKL